MKQHTTRCLRCLRRDSRPHVMMTQPGLIGGPSFINPNSPLSSPLVCYLRYQWLTANHKYQPTIIIATSNRLGTTYDLWTHQPPPITEPFILPPTYFIYCTRPYSETTVRQHNRFSTSDYTWPNRKKTICAGQKTDHLQLNKNETTSIGQETDHWELDMKHSIGSGQQTDHWQQDMRAKTT